MLVQQFRGDIIETSHPVRAVAVRDTDDGPETVWQSGEPTRTPWRSAGKPLQLWSSLEALGDPDLPDADLAIGASSHSGQDFHLARVRGVLERFGVSEDGLLCGAEPPAHRASADALIAAGSPPCAVHNDCSGKHAFMLAACAANGWDLDYRPPDHPLQRRIAQVVAEWTGVPGTPSTPPIAVDGCGVPTFGVTVTGMARAWARLAGAMADYENGSRRTDVRAARIGWAMARYPRLVSGDDRIDLVVATAATDPIVSKIGAQGVYCIALPRLRLGIALKCASGDEPALAVAIAATLRQIAPVAWDQPDIWPWAEVRNVIGDVVGRRLVSVGIPVPSSGA